MSQVIDFLPNYPTFEEEDFQKQIASKEEFARLKLEPVEKQAQGAFDYFNFQKMLARYLSPYTPYDKMLFYIEVGGGKCVHPDTVIQTSNITSNTIKELFDKHAILSSAKRDQEGEGYFYDLKPLRVLTFDHILKVPAWGTVSKFYRQDPVGTIQYIQLKDGKSIKKTVNHKLLTSNRGWVADVDVGDIVCCWDGTTETYSECEIVKITVEEYNDYLYDMEVRYTHCYVANGMITHNTCSSIAVHEMVRQFYTDENPSIRFNQTLVLAKGQLLLNNYKNEFLNRCPGLPDYINTPKEIKNHIKNHFKFYTLQSFVNNVVAKSSDTTLKQKFSNIRIIIDEGQDLKKHDSLLYKQLNRLVHVAENVTLIIMTGTPIIEEAYEPISVVNLLTPLNKQLPLGKKFYNEYYDENGIRNDKIEELGGFFRGKVAYVRQMGSVAKKVFMTSDATIDEWLDEIKVYACPMSDFQYKVYNESLKKVNKTKKRIKFNKDGTFANDVNKDDEKTTPEGGSFYQFPRESGMFVYPDGTYGKEGFEKHVVKTKTATRKGKVMTDISYSIPKEMKNPFKTELETYSSKYAKVMELLLSKPDECFYIYSDLVNNSGLILLGLIMELYGYKRLNRTLGQNSEKSKRFISLNYKQTTSENALKLVKSFSEERNAQGEYIQAVLGSEMSSYGITIKNIRNVIVLSSQWNWPTAEQTIGRGVRPGSDQWLKKLGLSTDVEVYLLVASAPAPDEKKVTTDVLLYQMADEKKKRNDPMLQLLKESSAICPLTYKRNVLNKDENYKCAEMEPTDVDEKGLYEYDIPEDEIDSTNYNLYFANDKIQEIIEYIGDWFSKNFTMNIQESVQKYNQQLFLMAIDKMITERIGVSNKFGKTCYIKEHNDVLYLQGEITDDDDIREVYYVEQYSLPYDTTIDDIIEIESIERDNAEQTEFCNSKSVQEAIEHFRKMNFVTQVSCFESCYRFTKMISSKTSLAYKISKAVVEEFKQFYEYVESGNYKGTYHRLYAEKFTGTSYNVSAKRLEETGKMRYYNTVDNKWEYVPMGVEREINNVIKEQERNVMTKYFSGNEYNMYGTISAKDNKFRIVLQPSEGKINKGKVCSYYKIPDLLNIIFTLDSYPKPPVHIEAMSRAQLEDDLLGQLKLTDKSIRENIRKKSGEKGYIPTSRLKEYLTVILMKIDTLCDFIQEVMAEKGIFYNI